MARFFKKGRLLGTVLTVTLQSLGAARANPVDSLHDE